MRARMTTLVRSAWDAASRALAQDVGERGRRSGWRELAWTVYVGLNLGVTLYQVPFEWAVRDWALWQSLPEALERGTLYNHGTAFEFAWSPLMAWPMALIGMLGSAVSIVLHVAAVLLIRTPMLIALTLVSWGFWTDAVSGNTVVYAFVAGILALRGHRPAAVVFLAFLVLIPRPFMLPLAAWILWRMSDLRLPALTLFAGHAAAVLMTGYAVPWIASAVSHSAAPPTGLAPVAFFGMWWYLIVAPAIILLTARAHVGWAGLLSSNYLVSGYLLIGLWEVERDRVHATSTRDESRKRSDA